MTSITPNAPDVSADDYLVIGLATCFLKAEGEVHQVQIAEPIPSSALEAIVKGIPTSYRLACGMRLGAVLVNGHPQLPPAFPSTTQLCDDFVDRAIAATRTYRARVSAQELVPDGTVRDDFNYSVERKRVLNSERIVKTEDNVKQHSYTHEVL
jgi:hypothetical protein